MKNEPQPHHKTNPHLTLTTITAKRGYYLTQICEDPYIQQMLNNKANDKHYIYSGHKPIPIKTCEKIYNLLNKLKPQVCVETGVSSGVTTTYILAALKMNGSGTLTSIDCQEGGWLIPEGLKDIWTFKVGYTRDVLPTLLNPIEFFFHDSLHTYHNMMFELEWAWKMLAKGGVIIVDNIATPVSPNNAFWVFATNHHLQPQFLSESTGMLKL